MNNSPSSSSNLRLGVRAHFADTLFEFVSSVIADAMRHGEIDRATALRNYKKQYLTLDTYDNFVAGSESPEAFTLRIIQGFAMVEVRTWRGSTNRPKGERIVPAEVYDELAAASHALA